MSEGIPSHLESLRITWLSEPFHLGIPIIDLQHIWLVHIILELEELILNSDQTGTDVDVNDSFRKALDYVSVHFALEEDILEHFNYPGYDKHVKGHRQFVQRLTAKFFEAKNNKLAALGILQILKKWLFQHILHDDNDYAEYFKNQNTDLKTYCNEILRSGKYPVSKEQLLIYQNIIQMETAPINIQEHSIDVIQEIKNIWKTYNLATDIPIIDLQHIWLLKTIVELDHSLRLGDEVTVTFQKVINSAIEYTKDHFGVEDKIMKYFRYTDVIQHMNQHKRFIDFIKTRNDEYKQGNPRAGLHLVQDLRNWLLSHIAFEDKKIGLAFRNRVREISEFTKKLHQNGEVNITKEQKNLYKLVMQKDAVEMD
ncbi:hemerythrin domain-containing protein [Leptospira sp. 96542]|nr:hemerythrin domain-containing protein [Leptospira sp. 96542]